MLSIAFARINSIFHIKECSNISLPKIKISTPYLFSINKKKSNTRIRYAANIILFCEYKKKK